MSPLLLLTTLLLVASIAAPAAAQSGARKRNDAERTSQRSVPFAGSEEAMQWADDVAQRRGLDLAWVRKTVGGAQFLPTVVKLMQPAPAGTAKNWRVYRSRFVEPVRIAAGVRFWQENQATLERAEQVYGVPPEIIVGILGVETIYGRQMGNFRVIDALATLAFKFPVSHPRAAERTAYFRGELEQFLLLQQQRKVDPFLPVGSYAGAMGMPQFMPSSWQRWAVDFDGDKRIDLAASPADVIGSVANYFMTYGWQPRVPTHYAVSFDPARADKEALLAPDILPTFSVSSFVAKGAILDGPALQHKGPLALIELQNGDAEPQYIAGTENFYVITRYNWSSYYAMAVIDLGREVKRAFLAQTAVPAAAPAPSAPADIPPAAPVPSAPADIPAAVPGTPGDIAPSDIPAAAPTLAPETPVASPLTAPESPVSSPVSVPEIPVAAPIPAADAPAPGPAEFRERSAPTKDTAEEAPAEQPEAPAEAPAESAPAESAEPTESAPEPERQAPEPEPAPEPQQPQS